MIETLIPGISKKLPLINPDLWLYMPGSFCNFNCLYCRENRPNRPENQEFLKNSSSLIKLPDTIKNSKNWILLYGGEPFANKEILYSLINEIRKYTNTAIGLVSNGSLITKKDIEFLKDKNTKITVSYDGPYQQYRGIDIFNNANIASALYKGIEDQVIIGLNTVIHAKNYKDYKFDLPNTKIMHDYTLMYPIYSKTSSEFLLPNELSDKIAEKVALQLKNLILDIPKLELPELTLKYPANLFLLLKAALEFCFYPHKNFDPMVSLCKQGSGCLLKKDIYGNSICGKGDNHLYTDTLINKSCLSCKYLSICAYKCPSFNFNKTFCKNMYIYKIYKIATNLIASLPIV